MQKRYWSQQSFDAFFRFAYDDNPLTFSQGFVGTSALVHSGLVRPIERFFACNAYLTIGSVETPRGEIFPLSEALVRKWLKEGLDAERLRLHTWITLDSLEILDLTLLPSLGEVSGCKELGNRHVAVDPDLLPTLTPQGREPRLLPNGLRYKPFLVGPELFYQGGVPLVVCF